MIQDAYWNISMVYFSISTLTTISLLLKMKRYPDRLSHILNPRTFDNILHFLHIPPYLIAGYWYLESYKEHEKNFN